MKKLPRDLEKAFVSSLDASGLQFKVIGIDDVPQDVQPLISSPPPIALVPPPAYELAALAVLLNMARRGDMRGVREWAAHVEALREQ